MPLVSRGKKRPTSTLSKKGTKSPKSASKSKPKPSKSVTKKKSKSKGTPIDEELRFQPFKTAPKEVNLMGSKYGLDGKWRLIQEHKKDNYEFYVYALSDSGPYLTIVHGGYADKDTGEWRDKWFWSVTESNPIGSDMLEEYIRTNLWSPKDILNGGLLKGSHVYRFEFREIRDKIKHDDSRDIRIKFGGFCGCGNIKGGKTSRRKPSRRKLSRRKPSRRKPSRRKLSRRKLSRRKPSRRKLSRRKTSRRKK